jgi:hypothetical protein
MSIFHQQKPQYCKCTTIGSAAAVVGRSTAFINSSSSASAQLLQDHQLQQHKAVAQIFFCEQQQKSKVLLGIPY